jgi:hypothetical protein
MKLISFDIGIKNMAYCIFDISGSQRNILDWNVLNLMEIVENTKYLCNCMNKAKNKKNLPKICGKNAKFMKNTLFFCDKHAKSDTQFLIPTKKCSPTSLKKMKNEELIKICDEYKILNDSDKTTIKLKNAILDKMFSYFDEKNLIPIIHKKGKSANETDLIYIGKKMKDLLNQTENINDITHVIIENQISPIANRMKTIQGMLAQYFIMKNDSIHIEFISSANKLKQMNKTPMNNSEIQNTIREPDTETKQNAVYKQHKIDGVALCSRLLDANPSYQTWKHVLETKKKDDLADCFLQGIWYMDKKFSKSQ